MLGSTARARAQSYDRLAEHFERLTALHPDAVGELIERALPERGGRAVDVGCGTGRHALRIAERYEDVLAVDVSAPMVEHAQRHRPHDRVTYEIGDVFSVAGEYDLVFSSAMLHHVDDVTAALLHLRSLVAPGGVAILADVIAPARLDYRLMVRAAPRAFYRLGAMRTLVTDAFRRRPGALEQYRLSTFRPWLAHLATDRFLTGAQFEETYGAVFEGAEFVALPASASAIGPTGFGVNT